MTMVARRLGARSEKTSNAFPRAKRGSVYAEIMFNERALRTAIDLAAPL
jgi:transcription elongation GreA/GreB family factor